MLFRSKSPVPCLTLTFQGKEVYRGRLGELPIREEVILRKSIQFFNDPEPCHIHRSAVRSRLTEEILRECRKDQPSPPGPLLAAYADVPGIDLYLLTDGK